MGSSESAEARRVSFEMDEEERVRVLQGIRLSESVVNRMKDCSQPSAGEQLAPGPGPECSVPVPTVPQPTIPVLTVPSPSVCGPAEGTYKAPQGDFKVSRAENSDGQQSSAVKEDLKKFQQEQLAVQDELVKVARKEKEATEKHLKASLPKKKATHEQQQSDRLNAELYKLSSQQFHEAASKAESTIKPRRVEPVCSGLQAQILRCYRDHLHEVLLCSDLAKAYQHCVSTARKG
ncbi:MICOS complex subunit Mic25 isoform X1 [Rattus norvegicus]|uniref:Coiled-coil-helix-coiled-coil-helix domain containing 6 n=1 Tax=Rattus norvegicus TaxID=10116 RepID=A0A8I5Y7K5_RAT|nr:MICOS complex subunit Mic25 isoform X1 [Rattus norvegicus]